jgi:hypothetical protein
MALGAILAFGSGCVIHTHGPLPPRPPHVVVRPPPRPPVVVVHPPPPPKPVIIVEPPPPPPPRPVIVVKPPPAPQPPVVVVTPPPRRYPHPLPPAGRPVADPVVSVIIAPGERQIIREWVVSHSDDNGRGKKNGHKGKPLPPGLAKKVARGEGLPPGWQKKIVKGEVMHAEVYRQCHPLPDEVIVRLPPPPAGTILVTIDGRVIRLAKATLEILDVFDVL